MELIRLGKKLSLKERLDAIDEAVFEQAFDGFKESRKRILYGTWEKGRQINESVSDYRGVESDTNWRKMSRETGRNNESLKEWYELYLEYPTIEEYEPIAETKATEWTENALKKHIGDKKNNELPPPIIPDGKYAVIYADPPWPVESIVMDKWKSPIDDKYPTMTTEEIKAMNIKDYQADDCSLFLWTTHSFLIDALEVMEAWGFKYFCVITWDKGGGWTQNGFHKRTELLLYGYKGKMNVDQYGQAFPTIFSEAKREHSRKPDTIRDFIKAKITQAKSERDRLELFSRGKHDGWTGMGNEA